MHPLFGNLQLFLLVSHSITYPSSFTSYFLSLPHHHITIQDTVEYSAELSAEHSDDRFDGNNKFRMVH